LQILQPALHCLFTSVLILENLQCHKKQIFSNDTIGISLDFTDWCVRTPDTCRNSIEAVPTIYLL
jgi:hypothetical protein